MVRWHGGRVATRDAVEVENPASGAALLDAYWDSLRDLTFGLVRRRGNTAAIGPVELLRFGQPSISDHAVEWPIEGGLLAGASGGTWRVEVSHGKAVASVEGYRPRLPRPVYAISQLQVHLLFTRLFLLRVRGREGVPGTPASSRDRMRAALVDLALCLTVTRLGGLRRRPRLTIAVTAAYHVACWSVWGQTLGGAVTRQRVLAVDGRLLTPTQSLLRLLLAPISVVMRRPLHDEIAGSAVVVEKEEGAALAAP